VAVHSASAADLNSIRIDELTGLKRNFEAKGSPRIFPIHNSNTDREHAKPFGVTN
jgi:hypothetical protein